VSKYTEIPTTSHVYMAIKDRHSHELEVFAGFTDTEGTFPDGFHGRGRMETWWAIKGTDFPIIAHKLSYDVLPDNRSERENERHSYFLCVALGEQ
jgi:hypothetical protein